MSNVVPIRQSKADRKWLSPAQVCAVVPVLTVRHLEYLRGEGRGPRYFKPTLKTVLYAESDVHAWVEAHMVSTRESS